jgi:hypothetical protein
VATILDETVDTQLRESLLRCADLLIKRLGSGDWPTTGQCESLNVEGIALLVEDLLQDFTKDVLDRLRENIAESLDAGVRNKEHDRLEFQRRLLLSRQRREEIKS